MRRGSSARPCHPTAAAASRSWRRRRPDAMLARRAMELPDHPITYHGLAVAIGLLVYVVASHLLEQRRHPTAAIAWVLFMVLLPYAALPMFLAFGSRKLPRPRSVRRQRMPVGSGGGPWVQQTIHALGQPAPAPYQALRIHPDGTQALAALWHTLDAAQQSIDVCTFILGLDRVGHAVIDRLAAKAQDGVRRSEEHTSEL